MNSLSAALEAILFFKNEPVKRSWLEKTLKKSPEEVNKGLAELKEHLAGRGISLMEKDDEVALRTAPEYADILTEIRKEALSKDLGKAGLETLSVILYRGPVTRAEIDYIRGVNSTFILRNLLVRGLVEKIPNPKDARGYLYRPTFDLLSYLGIATIEELPEYQNVREEIRQFETEQRKEQEEGKNNETTE